MSLGKVEAQLKTHSLVENICVYGDPYRYGLNFLCLSINFQDFPTSIDMYFVSLFSTRNENNLCGNMSTEWSIWSRTAFCGHCYNIFALVQSGASGLGLGWVELDFGCSTILLGQ